MGRDLPLTPELRAILATPECEQWLLNNMRAGASAAWNGETLVYRFEDDRDADRFEAWLAGR